MFDFLSNKFSSVFATITGKSHLTEKNMAEVLEKVRESLLEADVPLKVVEAFIAEISVASIGQKVLTSLNPGEQLIKIVYEKLKVFLGAQESNGFTFQIPATIMVMGLQGSGKTTSIAKMAEWAQQQARMRNKNRRILLASVDFYRPAAIDQLEILAKSINVSFYRSKRTDPVAASDDIARYAKQHGYELLFLDTAGRLHVDKGMMQELRAIDALVQPRHKILVIDSMIGQESIAVAQTFDEIGYQGAMLTKMDSDTRGGVAFAFRYLLKKPILFVGTGEKVADVSLFHADRMAGRILGMGDVRSLLEQAQEKIKESEQDALYASMQSGCLTLQDFANQMGMVSKLGSLTQVARYLPGVNLSKERLEEGEVELKRFKAIIGSMTFKERLMPKILDGSRKKRIAKGAGVAVSDVNRLLDRFEQTQQYAKLFKKMGSGRGFFR